MCTYGGRPFVLVPSLYHRKAPWEEWDPVDLVQKQEQNGVSHSSYGDIYKGKGGGERRFMKNVKF